jgi:ABC-type branched-subunit amino acid transport system ATPase component
MLSISKEVITEPSVMLVDEPAAGLAPNVADQVYDFLLQTREAFGAQILLVDQQVEEAMRIADYVYVLDLGVVKVEGPVSDFSGDRIRVLIREALYG